jgi:hypothetical protein
MCVVKNPALAMPLTLISIPALAGTLIINNKSCLNITDVTIDGAHQVGAIGPGATGNFNMDNRCSHVVHGSQMVLLNGMNVFNAKAFLMESLHLHRRQLHSPTTR